MGPWEHLQWRGATRSGIRAPKMPFSSQNDQNTFSQPWVWPNVKRGQNPHKTTFFMVLHQTRASRRFLTTLTKFDPKSILSGPKNPNFDPAIRTGWNQCYCKDYQILIPTIVHGLKLELEWPRYHENLDDASIEAPLTSKSHNFWSDRWIFKFHTVLEIGSQNLSKDFKINPIQWSWRLAALQRLLPWSSCWDYK